MYKLERVYATISFERNRINLLVVEHDKNHETHCLYYNSCQQEYLDSNLSFINHDELIAKTRELINGADKSLGMNIKRYIINVSCLPIKAVQKRSPNFQVFQHLTLDHANNHIDKVLGMNRDTENYALRIFASGWYLDGQFNAKFPEGSIGKEISFDYVSLISPRKIIEQFVSLLNEVSVKPLAITCNSLCLGVLANGMGIDTLVIDIKTNSTIINIYDKNGEIKAITSVPKGAKWFIHEVKQMLGVSQDTNILPSIEALDIIQDPNDEVVLMHTHSAEFLSIQQVTTQSLSTVLKIVNRRLFKEVEAVADELREKLHSNFNKAYLNVNSVLNYVFKEACPVAILKGLPVELLTNTVIGLEDYAANNMLAAIIYVHNLQTISQDTHTYSTDPYVSQKADNYQFKQNIWIKLGIISTRWAAKIGE